MLSFTGTTLLLKETVTMLKRRNMIHRIRASFLCMIPVFVSVIIPELKKEALLFYSLSYIYIYIYIYITIPQYRYICIYIYIEREIGFNIQLVSSSWMFHKRFRLIFQNYFVIRCKSMVLSLINGFKKSNWNLRVFLCVNLSVYALVLWRSKTLLLLTRAERFLRIFHSHLEAVKSISFRWGSDWVLKTQNEWYRCPPTIHTA